MSKKKRVGRPAKGLTFQVTLFLTASTYHSIEKLAKKRGITFSEAARVLLAAGLEKILASEHDT
jgi:hypothetical protein